MWLLIHAGIKVNPCQNNNYSSCLHLWVACLYVLWQRSEYSYTLPAYNGSPSNRTKSLGFEMMAKTLDMQFGRIMTQIYKNESII